MRKFLETLSFVTLVVLVFALDIRTATCASVASAASSSIESDTEGDAHAAAIDIDGGDFDNAPPSAGVDSNCDCEDKEALYHKYVRQLITANGLDQTVQFLKSFKKTICGSDGHIYSNECELQCTRVKDQKSSDLHRVRRINCKRVGKAKRGPKFGSKSGKLELSQGDPEKESHVEVCICPRNFFPICASNGKTYGNLCVFECAQKNIDSGLRIVKRGDKCTEEDKTVL